MMRRLPRQIALGACAGLLLVLSGCGMLDRFWNKDTGPKPMPLTEFKVTANARVVWSGKVGASGDYRLRPAVVGDALYAAGMDGSIARFDVQSGRQVWRAQIPYKLSGGVGANGRLVVVGTAKGNVIALNSDGKDAWTARVSSEVLDAPQLVDSAVVLRSSDNRIFALSPTDGQRLWFYERALPVLTLRNYGGVLIDRDGVFAGFPGGRLVALGLSNGNVGWEASVAVPKGATELERIADISSAPVIDGTTLCAAAYQGRVACFDAGTGSPLWSREVSSSAGIAIDDRNVYVSDDKGVVHALARSTGATVWKQDKLQARQLSAPIVTGDLVAVGDYQGYVHFLSRETGAFAARVATDGSPIRARGVATPSGIAVQTRNGGVFALAAK